MISRRTALCALVCSVLAGGCSPKNDLVTDTQSVRQKLIDTLCADTEVYSVDLGSSNKPGAGVTIATVRFMEGERMKVQAVMLWGPPSLPARDDELYEDDPPAPIRVADIDFSDVAANVEASIPMVPEHLYFMSVSSYRLPVGRKASWTLSAGITKSSSSSRTEIEYSLLKFERSPSGEVVVLP